MLSLSGLYDLYMIKRNLLPKDPFILISYFFFTDYISICPKLTHVACTSAVKYPVCVSNNQICDYYPNCPGGEDESDCLSYNRCDFQKDMCDWATANNTLFEWIRYYDSGMYQYCIATMFRFLGACFLFESLLYIQMSSKGVTYGTYFSSGKLNFFPQGCYWELKLKIYFSLFNFI